MVKNLPAMQETWVGSLVGNIPWSRAWQPAPIFLPGESKERQGLRGRVGTKIEEGGTEKDGEKRCKDRE